MWAWDPRGLRGELDVFAQWKEPACTRTSHWEWGVAWGWGDKSWSLTLTCHVKRTTTLRGRYPWLPCLVGKKLRRSCTRWRMVTHVPAPSLLGGGLPCLWPPPHGWFSKCSLCNSSTAWALVRNSWAPQDGRIAPREPSFSPNRLCQGYTRRLLASVQARRETA